MMLVIIRLLLHLLHLLRFHFLSARHSQPPNTFAKSHLYFNVAFGTGHLAYAFFGALGFGELDEGVAAAVDYVDDVAEASELFGEVFLLHSSLEPGDVDFGVSFGIDFLCFGRRGMRIALRL